MHNIAKHSGFCEHCYNIDCRDQFIYSIFDNIIMVFSILLCITFLLVPFRVVPAIIIYADEYFEHKYQQYFVISCPFVIAGIGALYLHIGIRGSYFILNYIYGYAFLPIMKFLKRRYNKNFINM